MKFLVTLLALAVPASLARITIETDENGERSVVVPSVPMSEIKQMESERRLMVASDADGYGEYDADSTGGMAYTSSVDNVCGYVELVAFTQEILNFSDQNDDGTTLWFPFYYKDTLKLAGAYTEEAIITHKDNGEELECTINSTYNFDYNPDDEMFSSTIAQTSSCGSAYGAITGGTGKYVCSTGHQAFYSDVSSRHIVAMVLYMCNTPCKKLK